jgi:F0F1-type ATP synthase delta subunit
MLGLSYSGLQYWMGVYEIKKRTKSEAQTGDLNANEKERVVASLKQNKPGTRFKVSYEVDPAILGGLQIFAGSEFLDCSLRSRIERLKSELNRIA